MISKAITVSYYTIEAAEADYYSNLLEALETMQPFTFESGADKYFAGLPEYANITDAAAYLVTLVREQRLWPIIFNEDGIKYFESGDQLLGDQHYALICPACKFILTTGCAGGFKKFLGQFSPEGVVRLNPVFREGIYETVYNWDCFKSVSIALNMPTGQDVTDFIRTKHGRLMNILSFLGGLKLDLSVSAGGGKELLSTMMVKDLIAELLDNEMCKSLFVKGGDFENAGMEEHDLKNAQLKYREILEIDGKYITQEDAKQLMLRAVNENYSKLFNGEV